MVQKTFNSCYLPSWVFLSPGPFFSLLEFPNHSVDGYGHGWPFYCKMYFTLQFWSLLPLMATLVWFFQNSIDSTSDGHTMKTLMHLSWARSQSIIFYTRSNGTAFLWDLPANKTSRYFISMISAAALLPNVDSTTLAP